MQNFCEIENAKSHKKIVWKFCKINGNYAKKNTEFLKQMQNLLK